MSKLEQSVVLIKPDGLQRGLLGEITSRFERKGLKLTGLKLMVLTDEILDNWYDHHKSKVFFNDLKSFMMSTPIVAMIWEGVGAVDTVRKLVGLTHGRKAEAGSIRGDFSMSQQLNLIHASDSLEGAKKEKVLIFEEDEVIKWEPKTVELIYTKEELE
jgi:nucleoside-diphosphate kinase